MKERGKITMQKTCLENCIKMFFTAFLIGLILSGCNKKDDRREDIEIVKEFDSSKTKLAAKDTITISKKKLEQTQRDLPKAVQIELKQTTPIASKNINENKSSKADQAKKEDSSPTLKPLSNINAEFPGGIDQFHSFFMKE